MKATIFLISLVSMSLLSSCITISVDSNEPRTFRYNGNFRYYAGIAEFFDCATSKKHYLGAEGLTDDLVKAYQDLKLRAKDDVYIRIRGFYREEEEIPGVDPIDVLVPTEIIELDTTRSCKRPYRMGL